MRWSLLTLILLHSTAVLACPSHTERAREAPMTYEHTLERGGVRFRWTHDSGRLIGEVRAKTSGWVLVGFHTKNQLSGARLIMGSVTGAGVARVEEHLAQPPTHSSRRALQGKTLLTQTHVERVGAEVILRFSMSHAAHGMGPDLMPGSPFHIILAYSGSPDLTHHSHMRTSVDGVAL